jgi:hypothetical protein
MAEPQRKAEQGSQRLQGEVQELDLEATLRAAGADLAVLLTQTLPTGVERFALVDGVWVTDVPSSIPLAMALRQLLLHVASAWRAEEGRHDKMEQLYRYLTGPAFCHKVEGMLARMWGDLEGIAGSAMPTIEGLEPRRLEGGAA